MRFCALTLVFALAIGPSVRAAENALCFGLGYLAEDVKDPVPLVTGTYEQLLDTLGSKLSSETLRKLIASGDPFAVPEQAETDLSSLRQRLRELRDMLGERKWDNPELRAALIAHLTSRQVAQNEQAVKVQTAIRETEPGFSIQMPSATEARVSPDGRYITTLMEVGNDQKRLVSYDLKTRQRIEGTSPYYGGRVHFSPDGGHLFFDKTGSEDSGQTYRVPFNGGNPQWDKAERVGGVEKRQSVHSLLPDPDGQRVYSRYWEPGHATFLGTVNGGPSRRLELPGSADAFEWGTTPKGDGLWFLHNGLHGLAVTHHHVDATGSTGVAAVWAFENQNLTHVLWSPDGQSLIGYGREGNSRIELVTASRPSFEGARPPVQNLELPKDASGRPLQIFDAKVHPKENRAAFLVNDKANRRRLVWYDLKTGSQLGDTPIPEKSFIRLAMDPTGAHFLLSNVEGQIYVGNLAPAPQR